MAAKKLLAGGINAAGIPYHTSVTEFDTFTTPNGQAINALPPAVEGQVLIGGSDGQYYARSPILTLEGNWIFDLDGSVLY